MEPLHYPAVATGAEELPPMATGSVDGQICAAVAAAAEGDDEPQASKQFIGQIDPKTPGWTRREKQELRTRGHFQSVILAGVLVRDETVQSFNCLFSEFLCFMGGVAPKTILIYQN